MFRSLHKKSLQMLFHLGLIQAFLLCTLAKHKKSRKFRKPEFLDFWPEFPKVLAEFWKFLFSKCRLKVSETWVFSEKYLSFVKNWLSYAKYLSFFRTWVLAQTHKKKPVFPQAFFVHFWKNSGPQKTQVFGRTHVFSPKTQVFLLKIWIFSSKNASLTG